MGRFDYVQYDEKSQQQQQNFKDAFTDIDTLMDLIPEGRAKSLALTKLEEAYMWVGKAIRDEQIKRKGSAPLQEERKDG